MLRAALKVTIERVVDTSTVLNVTKESVVDTVDNDLCAESHSVRWYDDSGSCSELVINLL